MLLSSVLVFWVLGLFCKSVNKKVFYSCFLNNVLIMCIMTIFSGNGLSFIQQPIFFCLFPDDLDDFQKALRKGSTYSFCRGVFFLSFLSGSVSALGKS